MQKNFNEKLLLWIYHRLYKAFGQRHWWPAKTRFEVIAGAILTQGTAWTQVEKSIDLLRKGNLLSAARLYHLDKRRLARTIRSSGFFNVKTERLKNFLSYLFKRWNGDLNRMFRSPMRPLRQELLSISGLGKETVDSILLYAGKKPIFVVDAYTRRIFSRHGLLREFENYDAIQNYFMGYLPSRSALFNEYHALLVEVGKRYCRKTALCQKCPLDPLPRTQGGCRVFAEQKTSR